MQLIITNNFTEANLDDFAYNYLPRYLYNACYNSIEPAKLNRFNKVYHIDSAQLLLMAVKNLSVSKVSQNQYIIKTNKNIKINNQFLEYYVKLISYGSRTIHGYPLLQNIFSLVAQNIYVIYKEYLDGNSLLRSSISR